MFGNDKKKGIIIAAVCFAVIVGLFSVFILDSKPKPMALTSGISSVDKQLPESAAYSDDPYQNEKNLLKVQQHRSDAETKKEVTEFVQNMEGEIDMMKLEVAKLDDEINYQQILEDADKDLEKMAEETGTTKDELLQSIENDMFASLPTTEASIELGKEISEIEEKQEELINRFVEFSE